MIKRLFQHLGLIATLIIFLSYCPAAAQSIEVKLLDKAEIDHEQVYLSDIALITCEDPDLSQKLGQMEIARIPLAGQMRWIHPGQVEMYLSRLGLDANQYNLVAAGPVKITRNYTEISQEKIAGAVIDFIHKHAPWDKRQMKVGDMHCPGEIRLPNGDVSLKVIAPKHTDWLGAVPFQVMINVNDRMARKISVTASIQVWSQVLVTAKPLGRGEPIGSDDIKTVHMNLAKAPRSVVFKAEDILGKRTKRALAANTILRNNQVEVPPLIRRGDVVRIIAESNTFRISTKGEAKEDGGKGERIRLVNLRSKKNIYAEVVDPGTVRVQF
jgi:flagella basal body P-ring formation protein FlgA